jgi:hypothetical protein
MYNVWFQQFAKRGACLYVVTSNDYVRAFKQSTLYSQFLNRVVNQVKGLIKVSYSYVEQPNLEIQNNLRTQF